MCKQMNPALVDSVRKELLPLDEKDKLAFTIQLLDTIWDTVEESEVEGSFSLVLENCIDGLQLLK